MCAPSQWRLRKTNPRITLRSSTSASRALAGADGFHRRWRPRTALCTSMPARRTPCPAAPHSKRLANQGGAEVFTRDYLKLHTPGLFAPARSGCGGRLGKAQGCSNPIRRAREYEAARADGRRTDEEVAAIFGVTRAAVCQYLGLLQRLPPEVLARVEVESDPARLRDLSLRRLVRIAGLRDPADRRAALSRSSSLATSPLTAGPSRGRPDLPHAGPARRLG
jgi:hypothetical protein